MVNEKVVKDGNITGSVLINYSYININSSVEEDVIAVCATGLGPTSGNNNELGGWYFKGEQIPNMGCSDRIIQPNGANISDIVGAIKLNKCRTLNFTTSAEGVYSCIMLNSSMMNQTMKLGVYFTGRGESVDQ